MRAGPKARNGGTSLRIGDRLGQYIVKAKLGEGAMGVVFRATDVELGRDVAIKVLAPSFEKNPESLPRFRREARVLASLNHPHIASIFGFEQVANTHAIVMEFVEGKTLADRMKADPCHQARLRQSSAKLLRALVRQTKRESSIEI